MARLFYNLFNGLGDAADDEGRETASSDEARAICIESIRSIVADECRDGLIDLTGRIEVVDQGGDAVMTVTYDEAFEIKIARR